MIEEYHEPQKEVRFRRITLDRLFETLERLVHLSVAQVEFSQFLQDVSEFRFIFCPAGILRSSHLNSRIT